MALRQRALNTVVTVPGSTSTMLGLNRTVGTHGVTQTRLLTVA